MLVSNSEFNSVAMDIYREMYSKSSPVGDWEDMMASGETKRDGFFNKYYMPIEAQVSIINKHCKVNSFNQMEHTRMHMTIMLGCSPTSKQPSDWNEDENSN